MINYQNGKIYKIESLIGDCIYYGSTCQLLCRRMAKHRYGMRRKCSYTSAKVLEYDDAKIYLVELYPCNSKEELHMREGWYIKNNDCVNKCIAGRTRKQYGIDNREKISKQKKQYRIDNREKISKQKKQYRIDNREKIKLRNTKQYTCICGYTIQCNSKSRHNKSKKHLKFVNSICD